MAAGRKKELSRRELLRSGILTGGMLVASLLGFLPVVRGESRRLRPPGALKTPFDEQPFLASCIKCGQCVQVCPVEAIELADLLDGMGVGVPYIEARRQACDFSCDGLQCVLACPTGALTHDLDYPADSRMGFARLVRPDACLAVQGKGFRGPARGKTFPGKLRSLGSTAHHVALVASGAVSAAVVGQAHLWDLAAGAALLERAGGVLQTTAGNPVDWEALYEDRMQPEPLIAGSPEAVEALVAILEVSPAPGRQA